MSQALASKSSLAHLLIGALLLLAAVAVECSPSIGGPAEQMTLKEANELEQVNPTRSALARFLFYNSRPSERQATQAASGPFGFKRSTSALDLSALTGVTLGKRAAPLELLNMEPVYGRQYAMRAAPRMYDFRWPLLDSFDAQQQQQQQQQQE